jgi:hypothetical protein
MEWRGDPRKTSSNEMSLDAGVAGQLWVLSEEMTGLKFAF